MRRISILTLALLLSGCINDSATYNIGDSSHSLTVRATQDYFWNDQVEISLLISRMPECQRRLVLMQAPDGDVSIELFASGENRWTLRAGAQQWQLETDDCKLLPDEPKAVLGERLGMFSIQDNKMVFEPGQAGAPAATAAAPAATAVTTPPAAAPAAAPADASAATPAPAAPAAEAK